MHIELLVHGNLYKEDALRISDMVESVFKPRPLPQAQWRTSRNLILPPGCNYLYERILANPENVNHCIEYILHVGDPQERSLRAKLLLLSQMLEEPVFDTLRTKEQLGYIVSGGAQFSGAAANYRILIQSEKPCSFLEHRIDAFLVGFAKALQEMPQQEFDAHKIGTINKRLEKLKNLNQESGRMWHHITSEAFDFELGKSVMRVAYTSHEYRDADVRIVQRDVEALEPLSKNDIIEFFNTNFSPSSEQRAKVSVHLIAQGSSVAATTEDAGAAPSPVVTGEVAARDNSTQLPVRIQDVKAFKASLALSAGLQPVKDITEFEDLGAKL
jgi:insulysin